MANIITGGDCWGPDHPAHDVEEPLMLVRLSDGREYWLTMEHLWNTLSDMDLVDFGPRCPNCGSTSLDYCDECTEQSSCRNCGGSEIYWCSDCHECDHDECGGCTNCGSRNVIACDECGVAACDRCGRNKPKLVCQSCVSQIQPQALASSVVDGRIQYEDGVSIQLLED